MNTRQISFLFISIGGCLLFLLFYVLLPSHYGRAKPVADQASWCQCVDYVRNRFQLGYGGPGFVGAADMGPYLEAQRFARLSEPAAGTIIVFQRWFGFGIDTTYGHVGVVTAATPDGGGWQLIVRGARQTYQEWTEYGCTNVSDMQVRVGLDGSGAAFYAQPLLADGSEDSDSSSVNSLSPTPLPPASQLEMFEPLLLSATDLFVGEVIHAHFMIQNVGEEPVLIERLTAGGRRGTDWNDGELADFPHVRDVWLKPGQIFSYDALQQVDIAGSYFVEPVVKTGEGWDGIVSGNRIGYTVRQMIPTITIVPTAQEERNEQPMITATPTRTDVQQGERAETGRGSSPPALATPTALATPFTIELLSPAIATALPAVTPSAPPTPHQDTVQSLSQFENTITPTLFSRWVDREYLVEGMYIFRAWGGPDIKLYLDGELILDGVAPQFVYEAAQSVVGGGTHDIRVEIYTDRDGAAARFAWEWLG